MIQSGGGDWIINSIPLGNEDAKVILIIDGWMSFMETLKPFDLTGTSSENDSEPLAVKLKNTSLCVLCLCGGEPILNKNDLNSKF